MAQESGRSSGIGGALRQVLGSLTEGVRYRGELFALELNEEKNSLISLLVLAMAALFSLFLSFLSLNILLLVLFWDSRAVLATFLGPKAPMDLRRDLIGPLMSPALGD